MKKMLFSHSTWFIICSTITWQNTAPLRCRSFYTKGMFTNHFQGSKQITKIEHITKKKGIRYFFSPQIYYLFLLKLELGMRPKKSMRPPGNRSSQLGLSSPPLCCWGRTEECVMTNQSAWLVCIMSKSHRVINNLAHSKRCTSSMCIQS